MIQCRGVGPEREFNTILETGALETELGGALDHSLELLTAAQTQLSSATTSLRAAAVAQSASAERARVAEIEQVIAFCDHIASTVQGIATKIGRLRTSAASLTTTLHGDGSITEPDLLAIAATHRGDATGLVGEIATFLLDGELRELRATIAAADVHAAGLTGLAGHLVITAAFDHFEAAATGVQAQLEGIWQASERERVQLAQIGADIDQHLIGRGRLESGEEQYAGAFLRQGQVAFAYTMLDSAAGPLERAIAESDDLRGAVSAFSQGVPLQNQCRRLRGRQGAQATALQDGVVEPLEDQLDTLVRRRDTLSVAALAFEQVRASRSIDGAPMSGD